jgi:hypothetical protein
VNLGQLNASPSPAVTNPGATGVSAGGSYQKQYKQQLERAKKEHNSNPPNFPHKVQDLSNDRSRKENHESAIENALFSKEVTFDEYLESKGVTETTTKPATSKATSKNAKTDSASSIPQVRIKGSASELHESNIPKLSNQSNSISNQALNSSLDSNLSKDLHDNGEGENIRPSSSSSKSSRKRRHKHKHHANRRNGHDANDELKGHHNDDVNKNMDYSMPPALLNKAKSTDTMPSTKSSKSSKKKSSHKENVEPNESPVGVLVRATTADAGVEGDIESDDDRTEDKKGRIEVDGDDTVVKVQLKFV